jgi:hypothetical protein
MSEQEKHSSRLGILGGLVRGLSGMLSRARADAQPPDPAEPEVICCDGVVHIAYRGLSDDHLYLAYRRKWTEVKFFKQRNLRVFCAGCRQRLL